MESRGDLECYRIQMESQLSPSYQRKSSRITTRLSSNSCSRLRAPRSEKQHHINRTKTSRKRDLHFDTVDCLETTDSSADEEVESSAAPQPDVIYSFDHYRSPSKGSQVLGHALAEAVDRYETKATEKLVKDEYLVLDSDGEPLTTSTKKASKALESAYVDDEDDYELL